MATPRRVFRAPLSLMETSSSHQIVGHPWIGNSKSWRLKLKSPSASTLPSLMRMSTGNWIDLRTPCSSKSPVAR